MHPESRSTEAEQCIPAVTLAVLAAWALVMVCVQFGGDEQTPWRWGLVPQRPSVAGLLGYSFLHANWGHLLANALPLFLLGPLLEDRWGRAFSAGFVVLSAVIAGGGYVLLTTGVDLPLVGANGVASALMGAALVRFWSTPVRFAQGLWALRLLRVDAWAPIWVMLPIWVFTRLLLAALATDSEVVGGAARWCDTAGFAFGFVVAAAMRWGDIEGRLVNRAEVTVQRSASGTLHDRVRELRRSGETETAYELLADSVRRQTADSEVLETFWDVARDLSRTDDAASLVLGLAGARIARGGEAEAVAIWKDVDERAPNALAPLRLILRVVPVLRASNEGKLAVATLRRAFDPRLGELRTAPALQLLDLAQEFDPPAALLAARRVLGSRDLPLEKRERIEALASELETICAELPPFDPEADSRRREDPAASRAIAIEPDPLYDVSRISEPQPERASTAVRELDMTGSLVESDSSADLVPENLPPDRWAEGTTAPSARDSSPDAVATACATAEARFFGAKVVEVTPERLAENGIFLRRSSGKSGRVPYAKIQALAVAAVTGLADKPVLVIDFLLNWNDVAAEQLQVLRIRSDRCDLRSLMPQASNTLEAVRALLEQLLARTGAAPLPGRDSVRGRPFSTHAGLADYERVVLGVDG
jgi:membrane associated rhomboid family serine protease